MSHSHHHSFRSFGKAPSLSAIVHGSNPVSFEDGLFLPSNCHSRTWLLDNIQETCRDTFSCQLTNCEQDQFTENSYVQSSCFPRVVQTTRSNSKSCERTNCQSGSSIAVKKCAAQPCQSGSSQKMSFIDQSCQPANYMAKCCPVKAPLSKSYQTLEYKSIQCQTQIPESSSYRPLVSVASEPQLLESSSTYEPTCCVTGGLQMPSK
nr:keratin-associated protein 27-1 [Castor canadensis]